MSLDIFKLDHVMRYNNDIKKDDLYRIQPSASSFNNLNKNGDIIFSSQQTSNPLDISNSALYYKISLEGIDAAEDVTLENNFFPSLFNSMRLKLGTQEVESVDSPGEISSLLNFVINSESDQKIGEVIGWIPDTGKGDKDSSGYKRRKAFYNTDSITTPGKKTFTGIFPLRGLFGFLESYNRVVFLLHFELILNRNINDSRVFYGPNGTGKLVIESLEYCMPELTLNPRLELSLLERLNTDSPVVVNFLKRLSMVIDIPEGSTFSWQPMSLSNRPRFILIGFKDPEVTQQTNNSKFIQEKGGNRITSLRVKLNNSNYPMNRMEFDIKNNDQVMPYLSYIQMCRVYSSHPVLDLQDFKNLYSVFCFDVSAQDEKLVVNGCNVVIEIEKDSALKLKCYCVVLEEKKSEILLTGGKMFSIN